MIPSDMSYQEWDNLMSKDKPLSDRYVPEPKKRSDYIRVQTTLGEELLVFQKGPVEEIRFKGKVITPSQLVELLSKAEI